MGKLQCFSSLRQEIKNGNKNETSVWVRVDFEADAGDKCGISRAGQAAYKGF